MTTRRRPSVATRDGQGLPRGRISRAPSSDAPLAVANPPEGRLPPYEVRRRRAPSKADPSYTSEAMDLRRVEKKLREAEFFLFHLQQRETYPLGNAEELDFLLSAFLSAARAVDYRLRHEQGEHYKAWRKAWDDRIDPGDRQLVKFVDDDRALEVHASGSSRAEKHSPMAVHMENGEVAGFVPLPAPVPGAIAKPDFYYVDIEGKEERATEVCAKYIALTRAMLAAYSTGTP